MVQGEGLTSLRHCNSFILCLIVFLIVFTFVCFYSLLCFVVCFTMCCIACSTLAVVFKCAIQTNEIWIHLDEAAAASSFFCLVTDKACTVMAEGWFIKLANSGWDSLYTSFRFICVFQNNKIDCTVWLVTQKNKQTSFIHPVIIWGRKYRLGLVLMFCSPCRIFNHYRHIGINKQFSLSVFTCRKWCSPTQTRFFFFLFHHSLPSQQTCCHNIGLKFVETNQLYFLNSNKCILMLWGRESYYLKPRFHSKVNT